MKKRIRASKPRIRLTRVENKAKTRARLIEVGRAHFLKYGIAGTVMEDVAEEAGFSRGAVYANFKTKADLFLAVFDGELELKTSHYLEILKSAQTRQQRVARLRQAFIDNCTDPVWILIRTEFEMNSLSNSPLRRRFLQIHRRDLSNALTVARLWLDFEDFTLLMPVEDFVMAMQSFLQGLAMKQRLLANELSPGAKVVAGHVFDCFTFSK